MGDRLQGEGELFLKPGKGTVPLNIARGVI